MVTGLNVNCLNGNREIPSGYVLNPATNWLSVERLRSSIWRHFRPSRVRTIIWFAERDPVTTPWLHIPLTDSEVDRIQDYAWMCEDNDILLELVVGCLWEALWLDTADYPQTVPIPDNPHKTPQELFEALQSSLWRLLFTGRKLPPGTIIDAYNEFDLSDTQEPVMTLLWPWLRDAIKQAGLISTVSTIIDLDGTGTRAIAAYKWLAELGAGMPDLLELHVNGVPDAALIANAPEWAIRLRKSYALPLSIGEDDMSRDNPAACAEWVSALAPKELIRWVD